MNNVLRPNETLNSPLENTLARRVGELEAEITELMDECDEKDKIIHAIKTDQVKYKVDIVNDGLDTDITRKVILISEIMFAFEKCSDSISLLSKTEGTDWVDVSDLTELKVWEYQEIKSYAVAVGMITEDQDLFI